jgi:proton glutamate symport protein
MLSSLGVIVTIAAYGVAIFGGRMSLIAYQRAVLPAQAVAISTQSSLASLPAMLKGVATLGVKAETADMVLPLAVALFRASGPALNLGVAIYIAHWFGIELTPFQLAAGVAVAATTTIGAVSLPGTISFISSIAPIAIAMGVPIEPLAILLAVETIPDIFRTFGNVSMDVAVTKAIARQHDGARQPGETA